MSKQFVIIGPTSSGKTSLALKLSKQFGGDIVSVDSRQIFKLMDIGTGKSGGFKQDQIKKFEGHWEIDNTKVYGYDLVFPNEFYSAYDYNCFVSGLNLKESSYFVGGTGFYIDVLLGNVKPSNVPPDPILRETLSKKTLKELVKILEEKNPSRLETIDKKNKVRLIRAIEMANYSGDSVSFDPYFTKKPLIIGLTSSRENLYKRVDKWLDTNFDEIVNETKMLIDLGYKSTSPLNGLIYKTVVSFLNKDISKDEARERCKFDLHAYIRRQLIYFKRIEGVTWFDILEEDFDSGVLRLVESELNE